MSELPHTALISIPDVQLSKLSTEDMLEWFNAEEQSIGKQVLALRFHRNERLPVNRLPDELLLTVFSRASRTTQRTLIYVTHVCRRWRDIGLHSPLLWTRISAGSFDRFNASLQRSLPAQVDVTCCFRLKRDNIPFLDTLASHASRVRRLDISFQIGGKMDLSSLYNLQMPNLEAFRFASEEDPGYPFDDIVEAYLEKEPRVLRFSPPWDEHDTRIRELSLRLVAIPWTSKVFCDLCSLELDAQNAAEKYTPSMETFLDVLQSCPRMERLTVYYSGPTDETSEEYYLDPTWRPARRVELPHLVHLSSRNYATHIGYLLAHLIIPESACIFLECPATDKFENGGDDNQLEQLVVAAIERGNLMCLGKVTSIDVSTECFPYCACLYAQSSDRNYLLCIRIYMDQRIDPCLKPPQAFSFMRRSFSKSPIQELTLYLDLEHIDLKCWRTTLRCIPNIRNLTLISDSFHNSGDIRQSPIGKFLQALDISATTFPSPLLPQLSRLCLQQLNINDSFGIALKDLLVNRARLLGCMDELSLTYRHSFNKPLPTFPNLDGLVRTFKHGECPSPRT